MWRRRVQAALLSLVCLSVLLGGFSAARAVAAGISLAPIAGAPVDAISGTVLSLPKAVEIQPVRAQLQPAKRDPRPGDDEPPLALLLLVAAVLCIVVPAPAARTVPPASATRCGPGEPRPGGWCPTGPPRTA